MERESNPMQALCRSGCGFYGSPATDGLCSLCYKEQLKKKQQLPTNTPASLSSYRDTSTAQPTISHLPSQSVSELSTENPFSIYPQQSIDNKDTISRTCKLRLSKLPSIMSKDNLEKSSSKTSNTSRKSISTDSFIADIPSFINSTGFVPSFILEDLEDIYRRATEEVLDESQSLSHQSSVATAAVAAVVIPADEAPSPNPGSPSGSGTSDSSAADSDKDAKKKKNRCATCRKKVGLTGFECRCGGLFCAVHRYSDKHDCSFNYREMGAHEIRRNNPVVVGEKIQKI